jgi:hypothetical protein
VPGIDASEISTRPGTSGTDRASARRHAVSVAVSVAQSASLTAALTVLERPERASAC